MDDEKLTKFNRNDNMRKSIKAHRKIDRNNTNKQCQNNGMETSLYEIEEFIDDDYGNMTSSKELDDLKDIEEYEFNKIYDAIRRIQRKRSTIVKKDENLDFQDTVLKKLDTIDKNVNVIKEDIACLQPKKSSKELESREYTISKNNCQFHSLKRNQELIRNIIARAIQKLGKNLENRRKSVQRDSQEHIVKIIAEMYENNNRSSKQIKELCNVAAEELVQNFSEVLETSTCECERENAWHGLKNKCFNDETLHNITIQNLIANYFEQTQEISQELEDFSDITIKCMDTQQMVGLKFYILLNNI